MKRISFEEWKNKAIELYGPIKEDWKFKCVKCGQVQTLQDFKDTGIDNAETMFYYSCIGRFVKNRGCDWTLGGLFQIHNLEVIAPDGHIVPVFEFADN
jgi:hypothetical protein